MHSFKRPLHAFHEITENRIQLFDHPHSQIGMKIVDFFLDTFLYIIDANLAVFY